MTNDLIFSFVGKIAKCTEGAVLDNPRISGTHCEVSSRSMTDADAAIWIKDTSSNGVWVNEKKIPKNETVKIFNRDIVSFAAGPVDAKCKIVDEERRLSFIFSLSLSGTTH